MQQHTTRHKHRSTTAHNHTKHHRTLSISFNLVPNVLDTAHNLTADQQRKELLPGGRLRPDARQRVGRRHRGRVG